MAATFTQSIELHKDKYTEIKIKGHLHPYKGTIWHRINICPQTCKTEHLVKPENICLTCKIEIIDQTTILPTTSLKGTFKLSHPKVT